MNRKHMASIAATIAIIANWTTSALADAASFLPAGELCVREADGASYIDRRELMSWTESQEWGGHVIPHRVWNQDRDRENNVVYSERLDVLANLSVEDICARGNCRKGDPEAVSAMQTRFSDAFDSSLQKHYLVLNSKGQPDRSWDDRPFRSKLRAIFDYKHSALRIKCLDKYEPEVAVLTTERRKKGKDRPNLSGVRVSLNREDLGTSRKQLRTIVPAKFSVTGDLENDGWTFAIEGYAGYRYKWSGDDSFGGVIPFVHVVQKTNNHDDGEIDKLGIGLDTGFYWLDVGDVQGGVEYLTDSKTNLDILAGQLFWFPDFGGFYINQFDDLGSTGIELKIRPRLVLHGGSIFDRGSSEEIASNSDYLRGGPGVRVQFRGTEGGSFEDFEFNTDAKYLFGIAGDTNDYYRIESSLNYFFPGQDHFSLGLSYTYGYQDETLEKEDLLEAVLGARF